jgi:hypothetical protein
VVTIRWQDTARVSEITPPEYLDLIEREDRHWQATLSGPVMELVRWCARQPIDDIAISQPDLASLFQEYYTGSEKHV